MPDQSRNKIKLNVRVTPSKKQEWQDALEPGETLSYLVQHAVDREIRDEYVHVKTIDELGEAGGNDTDIDTSGIEDQIDELRSTVSAINRKIDTIAAEGEDTDKESVEELAINILPRLPQYPDDAPRDAAETLPGKQNPLETITVFIASREDTDINVDGSAQRLSTQLREPEHRVRQALLHLERQTTETVHSAVVDGTRHWVRF